MKGSGSRVQSEGFRVRGSESRVQGSGLETRPRTCRRMFRAASTSRLLEGLGFEGLGGSHFECRVSGVGLRDECLGCGVRLVEEVRQVAVPHLLISGCGSKTAAEAANSTPFKEHMKVF